MLAAEQQQGSLSLVVRRDRGEVPIQLLREVGVAGLLDQGDDLDQVVRAPGKVSPRGELGAQVVRLAKDALGGALIVPEAGLGGLRVELGEPELLCV